MTRLCRRLGFVGVLVIVITGCGPSTPAPSKPNHPAAAKVENPKAEGDLATVTLSPEAEKHLAIATTTVTVGAVAQFRTVGAEAMVPPGKSVVVTAPISGTLKAGPGAVVGAVRAGDVIFELVPLQQLERDVRDEAERAFQEAQARLTQTTQRAQRLEQLLKEGSTSARAVEEAIADRTVATAAADAAGKRRDSAGRLPVNASGAMALAAPFDGFITNLRAASGQTVSAGAPVADLAQTGALWVRASVYVGDLALIDASQPAQVGSLGQEAANTWREARRMSGPPAATASAASVDLYFELPGAGSRPGERLALRLPLKTTDRALVVPRSAVVYDMNGGTWIYEQRAPHQFARRRVELGGRSGGNVIVARGLTDGMTIVVVGAAELYGTEFYVSK
jgi:cobalt-zinc-cadmium efflux system membrane fusion protein